MYISNEKNVRYYMDETSRPYEEGESPFPRTKEDDDFDKEIMRKYDLSEEAQGKPC